MKKVLILLILLVLSIPFNIDGLVISSCDNKELSNLKRLASNINIDYIYKPDNESISFDIVITNIPNNIYVKDNNTNDKYYENSEVTISNYSAGSSLKFSIYSNTDTCKNILLTKRLNIPSYNYYYDSKACNNNPEHELCQKWVSYNGTYEQLEEKIIKKNEVEQKVNIEKTEKQTVLDKILNIYIKYYYIVLPVIIIILGVIIYIKNRKDRIIKN